MVTEEYITLEENYKKKREAVFSEADRGIVLL